MSWRRRSWRGAALPALFLDPEHALDGAGASMVAAPGAPRSDARLGEGFGANVLWLLGGMWLFWHWRHRNFAVALLGLMVQAQIAVNHLLDAQVSLRDVDASGFPDALGARRPGAAANGSPLSPHFRARPSTSGSG